MKPVIFIALLTLSAAAQSPSIMAADTSEIITLNPRAPKTSSVSNPKLQPVETTRTVTSFAPTPIDQDRILPRDILSRSAAHFPQILEAFAMERAARGDLQAAEGGFDLIFNAEGYDRVSGFWTGSIIKTEARQNLRQYGAQIYGGYRLSDGVFPIYEDINFTNTWGEVKVGALFSLLRDRDIDPRRFRVTDAQIAAEQARLDVLLTQVGVQQKALNAYWRWVAAGRELQVYRNLLKIANDRQAGLEKQVSQGAKPEIAITENLQNIIRRKVFVTQAERNFTTTANDLSFYFRDSTNNLIAPSLAQLPDEIILPSLKDTVTYDSAKINEVLENRPELRRIKLAINRAKNKIKISENNLKPKLDLNVEISRDFGNIAEGGLSRDSTDTVIGFKFSVPLQRREAKGRLSRAAAELRAARLYEQRVQDQIEVELSNILVDLTTALKLSTLAKDDVTQSSIMVEAEQNKFRLGASDFFLVNIREERAADAEIRAVRAKLNGRIARTSYDAATISLPALGL
jgi:outer membrane protein TolC